MISSWRTILPSGWDRPWQVDPAQLATPRCVVSLGRAARAGVCEGISPITSATPASSRHTASAAIGRQSFNRCATDILCTASPVRSACRSSPSQNRDATLFCSILRLFRRFGSRGKPVSAPRRVPPVAFPKIGTVNHLVQSRRLMTRFRISLMSSIAKRTPSRPSPESLTPPYGMLSTR